MPWPMALAKKSAALRRVAIAAKTAIQAQGQILAQRIGIIVMAPTLRQQQPSRCE